MARSWQGQPTVGTNEGIDYDAVSWINDNLWPELALVAAPPRFGYDPYNITLSQGWTSVGLTLHKISPIGDDESYAEAQIWTHNASGAAVGVLSVQVGPTSAGFPTSASTSIAVPAGGYVGVQVFFGSGTYGFGIEVLVIASPVPDADLAPTYQGYSELRVLAFGRTGAATARRGRSFGQVVG